MADCSESIISNINRRGSVIKFLEDGESFKRFEGSDFHVTKRGESEPGDGRLKSSPTKIILTYILLFVAILIGFYAFLGFVIHYFQGFTRQFTIYLKA